MKRTSEKMEFEKILTGDLRAHARRSMLDVEEHVSELECRCGGSDADYKKIPENP